MSLTTLSRPQLSTRRLRLPGSPHWGHNWKIAIRNLRAAVENALHHAGWQSRLTSDQVGMEVIDLVGELDGRALAVLHVLIGELAKQTKKRDRQ